MATSGISRRTGTDGPSLSAPLEARPNSLADASLAGLRFAMIGTGRLGASLAAALSLAGAELVVHTAVSPAGRDRGARALGLPASPSVDALAAQASLSGAQLYVLAVPDDSLAGVARELATALAARRGTDVPSAAPSGSDKPAVFHTSGATTVEVLDPLAALGFATLSFHPLQTFGPGSGPERLRGVAIAVTAGRHCENAEAAHAEALGFHVARAVGARPFVLHEDDRVVYHAAACFASNYLVTLEHLAEQLFVQAGLSPREALPALLPLVQGTVDNLREHGAVEALTGPLSRGDVGTIRSHLAGLARSAPEAAEPYRVLGRATLDLVRTRGRVPEETMRALEDLFTRPEQPAPAHDPPAPRPPAAAPAAGPSRPPGTTPPRRSQ